VNGSIGKRNALTFLRRISTLRLLVIGAALAALGAGTAAIAIAATAGGPTPPPEPLASAVHDALAAPNPEGVSARVEFTDNLIGESVLEGSDPLLGGASGRLWASADGRLRLELQADVSGGGAGDFQVLVDGDRFTIYDPGTETVYRGDLPARQGHDSQDEAGQDEPPSLGQVQAGIEEAMEHATLSGATPSDVAGQPAYTVRVSPKENGGLVGGAELAWDAANGVPLRAALYAKGESSPVLELKATEVSFGEVSDSVFEVPPPPGAKVVDLSPPQGGAGEGEGESPSVTGLDAVQRQTSFAVSAPPSLAGMARDKVRLVADGEDAGALVTYGQGLGGLAVLELPAGGESGSGGDQGLQLPGVSIPGATGAQELETPLGTLIRFQRNGVEYTVAGSVTPAVAREAAQGL
jgi:outer membrane lipoprotein-sorting protein